MAQRVVRRMLSLLLLLDDRPDGVTIDELCRRVGYTSPDEEAAWAALDLGDDPDSHPRDEGEAHRRIRERASKSLREDVERLRRLGFHIREERRATPGDLDYHVRLTLEERPFVPVTLEPEDVASVVEWATRLQQLPTDATGLSRASIEFGRAAEIGMVVQVNRGERSWTIHPWQIVIRGDRTYGVGMDLETKSMRTLRLDTPDSQVIATGEALGPASDEEVDISRFVDPLTWGEHHIEVQLTTQDEHVEAIRASLQPAVVDVKHSSKAGSAVMTLSVSDLGVAAWRIVPLLDRITISSVELTDQLHRIADQLDAAAPWLPGRAVTAPMAASARGVTQEWREEVLAPPGPMAPEGRRDSTSDTGALLLALNFLEETADAPSISEISRSAGRSPREIATLLATYLDLWLDMRDAHSAATVFSLLDKSGEVIAAEDALRAPQKVARVRWEASALADIGRFPMSWQSLCGLLIKVLAARDSGLLTEDLRGNLDVLIADLERRLGLDADQLTVLEEDERDHVDPEESTRQWLEWSRKGAVVRLVTHETASRMSREVDVQPIGATEDGRLVGIDPHRPGSPPESRVIAVPVELVDDIEVDASTPAQRDLTEVDRARAIEAAGLTRLVTFAVEADAEASSRALSTLLRVWQADIALAEGAYVAMIRLPLPAEPAVEDLLVEHPSCLRVVAPPDLVNIPRRLASRIRRDLTAAPGA